MREYANVTRTSTPAKPDPRPVRRVRLSPAVYRVRTRKLLRETKRCECGCGRPCQEIHHAIGGSGREDVPENWTCLNHLCHMAFTSKQRVWDLERAVYIEPVGVAAGLRQTMETRRLEVLAYVLTKKGQDWTDSKYPLFAG